MNARNNRITAVASTALVSMMAGCGGPMLEADEAPERAPQALTTEDPWTPSRALEQIDVPGQALTRPLVPRPDTLVARRAPMPPTQVVAPDHHFLGAIGAPCEADDQCRSGQCFGWCTRGCVVDADCDDEVCARSRTGRAICFPRCETAQDCAAFEMSSCETVRSTVGRMARVCSY